MDHIIDNVVIELNLFDIVLNWLPAFLSYSLWSTHLLSESILSILNRFHDFSVFGIWSVHDIISQGDLLVIDWFFIGDWFCDLNSLNLNLSSWFSLSGKWDFLLVSCFSWRWGSDGRSFWCLSLNNFYFWSGNSFNLSWFLNCRLNWLICSNWGKNNTWSLFLFLIFLLLLMLMFLFSIRITIT